MFRNSERELVCEPKVVYFERRDRSVDWRKRYCGGDEKNWKNKINEIYETLKPQTWRSCVYIYICILHWRKTVVITVSGRVNHRETNRENTVSTQRLRVARYIFLSLLWTLHGQWYTEIAIYQGVINIQT